MTHKDRICRRRSDFTMSNLNAPHDAEYQLEKLNVIIGEMADTLADIADMLNDQQAERKETCGLGRR